MVQTLVLLVGSGTGSLQFLIISDRPGSELFRTCVLIMDQVLCSRCLLPAIHELLLERTRARSVCARPAAAARGHQITGPGLNRDRVLKPNMTRSPAPRPSVFTSTETPAS
ncbi:hypothetical protein ILYODFUR_034355 [Ilyodon furcidens]|uniref:Secreted protein n=1 Tax=Ilyodon furcidens TaxID=33524 RepID=A0ABV0TQC6_9TELE